MLFNSIDFILLFLPATLLGAFLLRARPGWLRAWVVAASLFFYLQWHAPDLALLALSIVFNFALGRRLSALAQKDQAATRGLLVLGIAVNLAILGFFKYADFVLAEANAAFSWQLPLLGLALPLGISFFTFHQISYLIDLRSGMTKQADLVSYSFSVAFFPQLIAGPIVRFRELVPQIVGPAATLSLKSENLSIAISLFAAGLFKKVFLADSMIPFVDPVFQQAEAGTLASPLLAWAAVLAYSLQIYFDFSAYSDMALGLARLFGIKLPANFNSPYKATSIIEFWRRWHITLSRFLRDYLYIPLGGNRHGKARRYANLLLTMLLGGIWHGAGWTFALWGLLHGLALTLCHLFREIAPGVGKGRFARLCFWVLTFLFVNLAWVIFRSESLQGAYTLIKSCLGLGSLERGGSALLEAWPVAIGLAVALFAPNLEQIMRQCQPVLEATAPAPGRWSQRYLTWQQNRTWALIAGLVLALALSKAFAPTAFLYFEF